MDGFFKSIGQQMGLQIPTLPPWLAQAAGDLKSLMLTGNIDPPIVINGIQYHLDETIGEGGYSMVYSARQVTAAESEEEPKRMAVKETMLGTSEAEARYESELETLMSLQHPNVLPLLGHCRIKYQANETGYFLTPLFTGSLESLVSFRRLSAREILIILSSMCSALAYCHEDAKRSHRDIKASNILISHREQEQEESDEDEEKEKPPLKDDESMILSAVICDWGSAGPDKQPLPKTRQEALLIQEWAEASVTASYRAIELWDVQHSPDGSSTDQETPFPPAAAPTTQLADLDWTAADMWAVGCVIYAAMYGGQSPYQCDRGGSVPLMALSRSVKFPFPLNDPRCYPESFHDKVMSCLEISPLARPTAREIQAWAEEEMQKLVKT
jgi:serine/threonine protein kinase